MNKRRLQNVLLNIDILIGETVLPHQDHWDLGKGSCKINDFK